MNAQQRPASEEAFGEEAISFATLLDVIFDNRWLIVCIALAATLLGSTYAFLTEPVYSADLLVQVEDGPNSTKSLLGGLSFLADVKADASAEIEILRSRTLASQAVDNLHLDVSARPRYFPLIGAWIAEDETGLSTPGVFGRGGYAWGAEKIDVARFTVPRGLENKDFILTVNGQGLFSLRENASKLDLTGKIGQELNAKTRYGDITLNVAALEGKPGAQFILHHASRLETLAKLRSAINVAEKGKQSGILNLSLQGTDPQLITSIVNEIGEDYVRQNIARKSEEAEKTLAFLDRKLPELRAELELAENKYNQFRNSSGTINLGEESKLMLQQNVAAQTKLIELKQKKEELLIGFTSAHPAVVGVNRQIEEISRELDKYTAQIKKLPLLEQNLFRLNRDVKVNTDLYTALLNSAQQLRLVKAGKTGNVRIIDPAIVPDQPIKPHRGMIVLLSALLGVVAGLACAGARKYLFGGVSDAHEIEQALGVSVFASVAHSEKQAQLYQQIRAKAAQVSVLAQTASADTAIEGLRGLRTALQFSMLEARNKIVLVTGPTPGLGKSFVSVNFSAVLAATGKKVLLIDADFRKGYLHQYFGLGRQNGMSDLIAGSLTVEQALHRNVVENVDFISTGDLPSHPAELLSHANFRKLMESLAPRYDYVLLDTAPVLPVTDALIAAEHAATVLLVARADVSSIGEIKESLKRLDQSGISAKGVVLNGVRLRPSYYGIRDGKYRQVNYAY
ncbi:MAG: exopolysaccharide transport family protein [Collimonas fungivorans]|uniref:polysaccharide biosynthesis tyrosine autokinase n=1 Tax=Collimonas fungivorans TaxID=158899 RepID=UPI0026EFFE45|nr:polysaccharide biosynthesis tyrosine autokinase [Collimonas fungivorans]MDB5766325.1 exopolysaccharide transport family protein [Collimonas fungivorans]